MYLDSRDLAIEHLRCFCAGDIDGLEPLQASDLNFTGAFHTYTSAWAYLDSLGSDPPEKCECNILSVTESANSVALFYEYQKPDCVMRLAQLFDFQRHKIKKIILIFDGRRVATPRSALPPV